MAAKGVHLAVDRAYYVEVDEAAGIATVAQDYVTDSAPSLVGTHPVASFSWSVNVLRRGECHVVADTQDSPVVPPADRAALAALRIMACMGAPLTKAGALVGALCVTASHVRRWTEAEVELLREVGERIWSAIERARAEAALRESEERLALAFRTLPVGIAIVDATGEMVTADNEMRRFLPTGRIPSRDPGHSARWRGWDADGAPFRW